MKKIYNVGAYAKINLFLRVCGKYENGYHRLFMLMQKVSLEDSVEVAIDPGSKFGIELDCDIPGLDVTKNLCYKAAKLFYDKLILKNEANGISTEESVDSFPLVQIKTVKNIPSEAGLGGGSSDAAAVLYAINDYQNSPFTAEELLAIEAKLGADVPFFFCENGSAFCEGIGEILTDIPSLSGLELVIVKPDTGVPTGPCYNICDEYCLGYDEETYKNLMTDIFMDESLSPIERIRKAAPRLTNDLQRAAIEINPRVSAVLEEISKTNPAFSMMSGSGSSCFGIYESKEKAAEAIEILKNNDALGDCKFYSAVTVAEKR